MSQQITEAFVKQFRDGITLRAQQMESRLRGSVRNETVSGTSASFDFIGSRSPAKRQSRHADTVLSDTPHDRRWVEMSVYDDADLIDKPDLVRTLTDPTNSYTKAMAAGFGRKMDEVTVDGLIGATKTGVDGGGAVASALVGVSASTSGMNLEKMVAMKQLFDEREQPSNRQWVMTAEQFSDLLTVTGSGDALTSADYNSVKVLVQGDINSFMGFQWHRLETLPKAQNGGGANDRQTIAWVPDAGVLAFGSDVQASMDRRPDKNNSLQIFYSADFGAARLDDNGVVIQHCQEA